MLDAANVLMTNYQLVAPRTPVTLPNPTPTPATATAVPTTQTSDESKTTTTTTAATSSDTTAKVEKEAEELPTTSSAAALNKTPIKTEEPTEEFPVAKHNQVTIEDLGGEEDQVPTMSSALPAATTGIDSTAEHINELRKRRLKFLEERNKTSTE